MFSGSPARDAAAHGASTTVLTEHDWQVLEKIAPRPIWERLAEARALFERRQAVAVNAPVASPDPVGDAMKLAVDVPTTRLPDGKVQMYYRLRHYGGVGVTSARAGGTDRRTITVAPANLTALVGIVTAQLAGKGTVVPLPNENTLVITCEEAVRPSVLTLLAGVDVQAQQVEISAKIFEISHDFDFQIGARTLLEHLASGAEQSAAGTFDPVDFVSAAADGTTFQGGVIRLLQVFEKAGMKIDTTIRILADTGLVKVVASPRMTAALGKTAYMLAGQELPIQSARYVNEDQLITEKTTYKPVGVQLYVTPQVAGRETVKLHVVTAVSAIAGFSELSSMTQKEAGQALINPVLDSREAETTVTVENESTLVIGGLRMIRTITRERKLPGVGDVPMLEWFFKSHRSQNRLSDLYFFLTPRLIKTNDKNAVRNARRPAVLVPVPMPLPVSAAVTPLAAPVPKPAFKTPATAPAPKPAPAPAPNPAPTAPAPAPPKAPATQPAK